MPYNAFTLEQLKREFSVQIVEATEVFSHLPAVAVSAQLRDALAEGAPLALAISTEKARSELIIAPVLMEVRRQRRGELGLFSGAEFTVDAARGLSGYCDFLLSRSPEQLTIESPVVTIVEAKNESLRGGVAQCVAEMIAAQLFNASRGAPPGSVYGAVTTGSSWLFLRLDGSRVTIDLTEYFLRDVGRVVGVLLAMIDGTATAE
ncbi:MAG: hypothetical protein R3A52_32800 [Polyangiales bacterium]